MATKDPGGRDDVVWRALAATPRRAILRRLGERELTAGEIAAAFPISRPAVSQHLTTLKEAGLLTERRDGTKRLYRVNPRRLGVLSAWLESMGASPSPSPSSRPSSRPSARSPRAPSERRPVVREHEVELEVHPAAAWKLLADPQQRARWKGAPEPEVLDVTAGEKLRWRWRWTAAGTVAEVDIEVAAVGRSSVVKVVHRGAEPERWPLYLERLQVVARGWDPGPETG